MSEPVPVQKTVEQPPDEAQVKIVGWAEQHWGDLGLGLVAAVLTIVLSELGKGWVKLWLAKKFGEHVTPAMEENAVRTLAFLVAIVPTLALDFGASFYRMTGYRLDFASSLVVGCCCTWAGAQVLYAVVKEVRPVKALRVRLYRAMGVTQEEVEAARTTRAQPAVTDADIAAWRKKQGLDK